jgi:hypothetical protein
VAAPIFLGDRVSYSTISIATRELYATRCFRRTNDIYKFTKPEVVTNNGKNYPATALTWNLDPASYLLCSLHLIHFKSQCVISDNSSALHHTAFIAQRPSILRRCTESRSNTSLLAYRTIHCTSLSSNPSPNHAWLPML